MARPHVFDVSRVYPVMNEKQLFHEIVEAHGRTVLRVCASMLGPGADAHDACQETFIAALKAYPLTDVANVEAWLVRTAGRKCIDTVRKRRWEQPVSSAELIAVLDAESADATVMDSFGERLDAQVAVLSERQRFVVVHRYVAGWSFTEIADALGCSTPAARRCGADAIAALRRMNAGAPA